MNKKFNNQNNSNSESVFRRTGVNKNNDRFVLNVDETESTKRNAQYQSNKPAKNSEVYFANYQKNIKNTEARIYASSYSSKPTLKKETSIDKTQLFDNTKISEKNNNRSRINSVSPRSNTYNTNSRTQYRTTDNRSARYKSTTQPRNANQKLNQKKVIGDYVLDNFIDERARTTDDRTKKKTKRNFRRSQPNYIKRLLFSIISIVLVTAILSGIGIGCINDVLAINGKDDTEISVTIPEKATTYDIIDILKKADLIHSKSFCKLFVTFRGYSDEKYQSGIYYLDTTMGIEGMLGEIKGGNMYSDSEIVSLSFPEGWTVQQMMDKLVKNEVIENNQKFINALSFEYNYNFIEESDDVCTILEGFMFPDTYEFYVGESVSTIVRKFLDNFQNKWTDAYQRRAKELGLSAKEIVTIASIIQKEAANTDQMAGVSAVIHNRLKRSVDYPLLQCDSTANYYIKYINEIIGNKKETDYKDAYDTSIKAGLPAGPICNPGEDAIIAALYPDEESRNVYFCHDDNGKIYYAENDVEFARNLSEVQKVNDELNAQYY